MNRAPAAQCRRFLVSGTVQGVYYRAATRSEARRLGVTGFVANLPDGRVEVVACGLGPALDALAAWLWDGPPSAKVTAIEAVHWPGVAFNGFTVQ